MPELKPRWDIFCTVVDTFGAIGVTGLNGDPANPPRLPRSDRPLPLGAAGEAVVGGLERLGWHFLVNNVVKTKLDLQPSTR